MPNCRREGTNYGRQAGGLFVHELALNARLDVFEKQHAPKPVCLYAGAYRVWVAGTWSGDGPCVAKKFERIEFLARGRNNFLQKPWQELAAKRLLQDLVAGRSR